VGPWIVAVAMLAQMTSSSTTTTTAGGAATNSGTSSLTLMLTAAVAISTLLAAVFGAMWRKERAAAAVKIRSDNQDMNERLLKRIEELLTAIDELQNKNDDLRKENEGLRIQMAGLGLGEIEAQARLLKVQTERIEALQDQLVWQDDKIAALRKESARMLLELLQKPEASSASIFKQYRETVSGMASDISHLKEENQRQHNYIMKLQRELQSRARRAGPHGLRDRS
jgi:predicted RNase H-like nuclease (RuvC/YqgF family)